MADAAAGVLRLDAAVVAGAAQDSNVMVRRQALRTLVALKATDRFAVVERLLQDREPSVHVNAAAALATIHGPKSVAALLEALRQHGDSLMKKAATSSLKALLVEAEPALIRALKDPSPAVRWVSAQALAGSRSEQSRAALCECLASDGDYRVRFYALQSLRGRGGGAPGLPAGVLADKSTTVELAAVAALVELAPKLSRADASPLLEKMLERFRQYGDGSKRTDAAWGWRVVGNTIASFGEPGRSALESFRRNRNDKWLAWAAYQVLYVRQPNDDPALTTEDQAVATHAKSSPPFPAGGWTHDDPVAGPSSFSTFRQQKRENGALLIYGYMRYQKTSDVPFLARYT